MEFWFKMFCGFSSGLVLLLLAFIFCARKKKNNIRRTTIHHGSCPNNNPISPTGQSRKSEEIIYTTIRPNIVPNRNLSRSMTSVSTAFSFPPELLDNLSLTSEDLESLSRNPKFRKNPLGALRKAGATSAEIAALKSHPNFSVDPLAALKKPVDISPRGGARERLVSIQEDSSFSSRSDEPFLH